MLGLQGGVLSKYKKIHPLFAEIDTDSVRGGPKGPDIEKGPPRGSKDRNIWPPTFLVTLVPNQPKTAIKSILASNSYGSFLCHVILHQNVRTDRAGVFFGTEASFTYHTATWLIDVTTGRAYQSLGLFIRHAGSATKRLKQKSDKITNYPS